jgi:hypothetical protein
MGITVAPVGAWFLAWIALAPLWVLVVGSSTQIKPLPLCLRLSPLASTLGYRLSRCRGVMDSGNSSHDVDGGSVAC